MSDCDRSDSPSKSLSFRRCDSPVLMLSDRQDSENSAREMWMGDSYANVNGDDYRYQVQSAFFASSPLSFPSHAEDSFVDGAVCPGIAGTALFSQQSAISSGFSALRLSPDATDAKENCMPAVHIEPFRAPGHCHAVLAPHNRNPLGRELSDVETSDPISRSHVYGACRNATEILQTCAECTGFLWSVKARFNTKLSHKKVEFGTPNTRDQKNVEVLVKVQNMSTGTIEDKKFTGRLSNSNKKKADPGFLQVQFKGIKNDDLPHSNCGFRHVREFIDHAVLKDAQERNVVAVCPTYQLKFHGCIQYRHSRLSMDREGIASLERECKQSAALRHLVFERSKGDCCCCKLKLFNKTSRTDPIFTVEVWPCQFKVTERYEDQDMAAPLHHKHMPVVDVLRVIIDRLSQSKSQDSCGSSVAGGRSQGAPAAAGGGLPMQPQQDENWDLFHDCADESDDTSEDDFGAPERSDGSFATICTKRFRGC
jgi:hypothetical protein